MPLNLPAIQSFLQIFVFFAKSLVLESPVSDDSSP
jgi:hypothetical protein